MLYPVISLLICGTWFIMVYINITTWANEVYYVSSDFNAFLVRIELYNVFTSSDSYRDFYNCLKLSDFFQICTVNHLDLNNLLHALPIFSPAIVHPIFRQHMT